MLCVCGFGRTENLTVISCILNGFIQMLMQLPGMLRSTISIYWLPKYELYFQTTRYNGVNIENYWFFEIFGVGIRLVLYKNIELDSRFIKERKSEHS